MTTLFISYGETDVDIVRELADYLKTRDIDYWVDFEQVTQADDWGTMVDAGLQACQMLLLVISPEAMANIEVESQWRPYLSAGKPIIPFIVSPVETLHFRLATLTIIEVEKHGMENACALLEREIRILLREMNSPDPNKTILERPVANVEPKNTAVLRPMDMESDIDKATTRISSQKIHDLPDPEHFLTEQMVLEFSSYKDRERLLEVQIVPGKTYIVGRSTPEYQPDVDLNILGAEGQGISRQHAKLTLDNDTLIIRDNNSTNFTFVEGHKLTPDESTALRSGDRIQMGNFLFVIRYRPV